MSALFEDIKAARAMLAGLAPSTASEQTRAGYDREYRRLVKKGDGIPEQVLATARETTSASTWYRRKAAMLDGGRRTVEQLLKRQDDAQRRMKQDPKAAAEWERIVVTLRRMTAFLSAVQSVGPIPKEDRKPRSTKKRSLRGLPEDWREQLAARLPKHRLAFLTAALTGCRPEELRNGISLEVSSDVIIAKISGAKVTENAGQEQREIIIRVEGVLATGLREMLEDGIQIVRIESTKNFSNAIRDAGRRAFKGRSQDLSAYSLRHQFAADMKGAGWSISDVAAAMGHRSDKTASYYGDRQQRRAGGPEIEGVKATNRIKRRVSIGAPKI